MATTRDRPYYGLWTNGLERRFRSMAGAIPCGRLLRHLIFKMRSKFFACLFDLSHRLQMENFLGQV